MNPVTVQITIFQKVVAWTLILSIKYLLREGGCSPFLSRSYKVLAIIFPFAMTLNLQTLGTHFNLWLLLIISFNDTEDRISGKCTDIEKIYLPLETNLKKWNSLHDWSHRPSLIINQTKLPERLKVGLSAHISRFKLATTRGHVLFILDFNHAF